MSKRSVISRAEGGFTLVEALIMVAIMSILFLGVSTLMEQVNRVNTTSNVSAGARMIKQNVYDMLRNGAAWKSTLMENKALNCICKLDCKMMTSDPQKKDLTRRLQVYNSAGGLYYDSSVLQNGFTINGETCNSFPSALCPFRMDITWRMLCNSSNPANPNCPMFPMVEIRGKVVHQIHASPQAESQTGKIAFNPDNYAFTLVQPTDVIAGPPMLVLLDNSATLQTWCTNGSAILSARGSGSASQRNNGDGDQNTSANNHNNGPQAVAKGNSDDSKMDAETVMTDQLKKSFCQMVGASLANPEMKQAIENGAGATGGAALNQGMRQLCSQ